MAWPIPELAPVIKAVGLDEEREQLELIDEEVRVSHLGIGFLLALHLQPSLVPAHGLSPSLGDLPPSLGDCGSARGGARGRRLLSQLQRIPRFRLLLLCLLCFLLLALLAICFSPLRCGCAILSACSHVGLGVGAFAVCRAYACLVPSGSSIVIGDRRQRDVIFDVIFVAVEKRIKIFWFG